MVFSQKLCFSFIENKMFSAPAAEQTFLKRIKTASHGEAVHRGGLKPIGLGHSNYPPLRLLPYGICCPRTEHFYVRIPIVGGHVLFLTWRLSSFFKTKHFRLKVGYRQGLPSEFLLLGASYI